MIKPVRIFLLLAAIAVAAVLAVLGFLIVRNWPAKSPHAAVAESSSPARSATVAVNPRRTSRPVRRSPAISALPASDEAASNNPPGSGDVLGGTGFLYIPTESDTDARSDGAARSVSEEEIKEQLKVLEEKLKLRNDQLMAARPVAAKMAVSAARLHDFDPGNIDSRGKYEDASKEAIAEMKGLRIALDAEQTEVLDKFVENYEFTRSHTLTHNFP